ncbi:hypothetical protein N7468_003024 [Penicillium chermesinum]|uniref:GPI ethanolamine phosphate transferase 2 n=1 Tax=Penicillium chermesinum TaxID=63820 RepID=A0A9W9TR70_9EURO|nr:uncharacterized protein N7468_003024 [Penicillium chermesinum]KAJ5238405.1 hypothetical protein N7468_003024 [Penicillium chermesinum]
MARLREGLFLLLSNVLLIAATGLFISGLLRPKIAPPVTEQSWLNKVEKTPSAPFDRVIFLLVDALRSDFVFANNSGFPFTQELIRAGAAMPFTALAAPPTLTMPRVKAVTSGASPCFLDMFANIKDSMNRTEGNPTWLHTLKDTYADKKLSYAGTRTWTDLYPDVFARSHPTDANFVPDYTSVDEVVKNHVDFELANDDWSALILHMAGVDHIGHIGGPDSAYMGPKFHEIDSLTRKIFESIQTKPYLKNTLFILLGDHGMDNRGNHGGSLESEMSAALVFMSPLFQRISPGQTSPADPNAGEYGYHTVIDQSNIVPTVASLLGIPIPRLNLGVVIPELLPLWKDPKEHITLLRNNAVQMMRLYVDWLPSPPAVSDEVFGLWKKAETLGSGADEALSVLLKFCTKAQYVMSVPSGDISFPLIFYGLAAGVGTILSALLAHRMIPFSFNDSGWENMAIVASYACTMFYVGLIEYEHLFWYYASLLSMAHIGYRNFRNNQGFFASWGPLFLQFISQSWNQAGENPARLAVFIQKYLGENTGALWLLTSATYAVSGYNLSARLNQSKGLIDWTSSILSHGLGLTALLFKFHSTLVITPEAASFAPQWLLSTSARVNIIFLYRILSISIIMKMAYVLLPLRKGTIRKDNLAAMMELVGLYLMTQSRAHNIPLFLIFRSQLQLLESLPENRVSVILLFAESAYSAFGFTNSVAALDIPLGFNGVTTWVSSTIQLIQWQIFITMWAGSAWWICAGLGLLAQPKSGKASQNGNAHGPSTASGKQKPDGHINGSAKSSETPKEVLSHSEGVWTTYLAHITLFQAVSVIRLIGASIWYRDDPQLWTVILHASALIAMKLVIHTTVNCLFSGLMWASA